MILDYERLTRFKITLTPALSHAYVGEGAKLTSSLPSFKLA